MLSARAIAGVAVIFGAVATGPHVSPLSAWLVIELAVAMVFVVATAGTPWARMGAVAASLLAGYSAQLALTQPLWFQFFQLRPRFWTLPWYAIVAFQAVIAAETLRRHAPSTEIRAVIASFGPSRIAIFLSVLATCTVAIMPYVPNHNLAGFLRQSGVQLFLAVLNGASILALVASLSGPSLDALTIRGSSAFDRFLRVGRSPWAIAAFVFLVAVLLNLTAFDRMPRIPDEVGYLFQAKYMAAGQIYLPAPAPALAAALQYDWISIAGGKWFSIFPPGWAAILAVGVAVGLPFLVNPLLAAAAIVLGHRLIGTLGDRCEADLSAVLVATSPWYLAMAASLMSHTLTAVLMLGAWLLLAQSRPGMIARPLVAGLLMGWLFLTRPLDGIVVGLLVGAWAASRSDVRDPASWRTAGAYAAGCLLVGGLIFPYDRALTGHALLTPIDQYFNMLWHPGANRLGFAPDIGPPDGWQGIDIWPGHSVTEALIQAQYNLSNLNAELFGWGVGSLIFVAIHMIWGRSSRIDWWMTAIIGGTVVAYGLYWFHGAFYIGPRYWFVALWPAVYLSARGLTTTVDQLKAAGISHASTRIAVAIIALTSVALISYLPWRGVTKYWEFRDFHADYRPIAAANRAQGPLIFVRSGNMGDLGSAFALNAADLSGPAFVQSRGTGADATVARMFPHRAILFVIGRTDSSVRRARLVAPGLMKRVSR